MIQRTFLLQFSSITIALVVILVMLVFFYIGSWIRKYKITKHKIVDQSSFGAAEGALLGLLALLLSFTFNMSSSRHDTRIKVIMNEANIIGTAVLRADLYPDSVRKAFRHDFKNYVETRIAFFEAGIDTSKIYSLLTKGNEIQQSLWKRASFYGQEQTNFHRTSQMVPALNDMIDIVTNRNVAELDKVPELILYVLFLLCFTSAFMLGYSSGKKPDWIITAGFVLMIAMSIYLIIDLDRTRRGIITMNNVNQQIVNLRSMFGPEE